MRVESVAGRRPVFHQRTQHQLPRAAVFVRFEHRVVRAAGKQQSCLRRFTQFEGAIGGLNGLQILSDGQISLRQIAKRFKHVGGQVQPRVQAE